MPSFTAGSFWSKQKLDYTSIYFDAGIGPSGPGLHRESHRRAINPHAGAAGPAASFDHRRHRADRRRHRLTDDGL
jgi:hypothetical protein